MLLWIHVNKTIPSNLSGRVKKERIGPFKNAHIMNHKFLLVLIAILLSACESNPCEEISCGEHGTCNETTEQCDCDEFYEGTNCEEEVRAKFIGNWSGTGVCDYNPTNLFNLDAAVSGGVELDVVKIQSSNILQEFTITGNLDENNQIVIPTFMTNISSNEYDGTMVYDEENNALVLTLRAFVNGNIDTCVYTLTE